MLKSIIIIVLFLISVFAFYIYSLFHLPPGIEYKGNESTIAIISLITAIVSLVGSILAFMLKLIELRSNKSNK